MEAPNRFGRVLKFGVPAASLGGVPKLIDLGGVLSFGDSTRRPAAGLGGVHPKQIGGILNCLWTVKQSGLNNLDHKVALRATRPAGCCLVYNS